MEIYQKSYFHDSFDMSYIYVCDVYELPDGHRREPSFGGIDYIITQEELNQKEKNLNKYKIFRVLLKHSS